MSSKNIDGNFVFFDPSKENTVSTTIRYLESDGTFAYTLNQSK